MSFDFEAPVVKVVTPEVESSTVATPGGDGFWYWREDNGEDWLTWIQAEKAKMAHVPKKPWQGPLTAKDMAEEYNAQAARAAGDRSGRYLAIAILTPKGISRTLCVELPCTVKMLDALNAEPDPRSLPHW
jgi:hypothetical protein